MDLRINPDGTVQVLDSGATDGFGQKPKPQVTYVFVNRAKAPDGFQWYTLDNSGDSKKPVAVGIEAEAFTGLLTDMGTREREYKGKKSKKITFTFQYSGGTVVFDMGADAIATRQLLLALAAMTPAELRKPITIAVEAADQSENAQFITVYRNDGTFVKTEEKVNEVEDWNGVWARAIDNLNRADNR